MSKKRKNGARHNKKQAARSAQKAAASPESENIRAQAQAAEPTAEDTTSRTVGVQAAVEETGVAEPGMRLDQPPTYSEISVDRRQQQALELGRQLRQAREQRGMDIDDVAQRMHLPWRVIAKLESGDWRGIDSPIYLHGYLRSYTSLLGMPTPDLVEDVGQDVAKPQVLVSTGGISRGRYLMQRYAVAGTYLVITALIVVPVIILGINGGLKHNLARLAPLDPTPVTQPADLPGAGVTIQTRTASDAGAKEQTPLMASMAPVNLIEHKSVQNAQPETPSVETASAPAAQASSPESVSIDLSAPSWVEVTSSSGKRMAYALLDAGTHVYKADGALTIRLGNAGAAEVRVDGQKLDLANYRRANVAYFRLDAKGSLHNPPDA